MWTTASLKGTISGMVTLIFIKSLLHILFGFGMYICEIFPCFTLTEVICFNVSKASLTVISYALDL